MERFGIPDFLTVNDADEIMEEIFNLIPEEYDRSEGQHYYNFVKPTANIVSRMRGFDLPKAISLIWPKYAYDEYLDLHAETRNIKRKEAQYAIGEVTFKGKTGLVIPSGYTISTESKNDVNSKDYVTTEECIIPDSGTVTVAARAKIPGIQGNTPINTIVVNTTSFDDVTAVSNSVVFTGGIDEENDESLYRRIHEYDLMHGDINTGNPADYKRWAESVEGTGEAMVIRATDNSGLVTIILTDGNGDPASPELCEKVYNYIMSPDDEYARLAPCGAFLIVNPPTTKVITISAIVKLRSGMIEDISSVFLENIKTYFREAIDHGEVLYHRVCNVLGDIEGVYDFTNLYINGAMSNVKLESGVFPVIGSENISLTLAE